MLWLLAACDVRLPWSAPEVDPVYVAPVVAVPMKTPPHLEADPELLWTEGLAPPDPEVADTGVGSEDVGGDPRPGEGSESGGEGAAEGRPWRKVAPPLGQVQHQLCHDEEVRARLAPRISADPGGVSHEVLAFRCAEPSWCGWLRENAARVPASYDSPWWSALAECDDPASLDALAEASSRMWLLAVSQQEPRYDERLAVAIAEAMASDDLAVSGIGLRALAELDAPEAERDLVALHRAAPERWRDEIALSLWGRTSPQAGRIHREACARIDDFRCDRARMDPLHPESIRYDPDPGSLFERLPEHRSAVAAGLRQCLTEAEEAQRRACAVGLVRHQVPVDLPDEPAFADLRTAQELGDELVPTLVGLGVPVPEGAQGRLAIDLLVRAGLARPLDDLLAWPQLEERLLLELAPRLRFEAILPSAEAPVVDGRQPMTTLYAYDGARRYRVLSEPVGLDLPATIGLVNAALEQAGEATAAALDRDGRFVIVADRELLRQLARRELVLFASLAPPEPAEPAEPGEGEMTDEAVQDLLVPAEPQDLDPLAPGDEGAEWD